MRGIFPIRRERRGAGRPVVQAVDIGEGLDLLAAIGPAGDPTVGQSQAEGGVPLVMDTLEILGADNLAHGRWGEQKLVVRLAHQERPTAGSTLWLHLAENQLHLFDGETGQRV